MSHWSGKGPIYIWAPQVAKSESEILLWKVYPWPYIEHNIHALIVFD